MNEQLLEDYRKVREIGGFYETKRGLIKVWGKEATQFLNGLMSNDAAKLEENAEMLAAFPNAQGRLLAVVRVIKKDDAFLFETEEATREKVFQTLFRFTYAGDFYVENLTDAYRSFEIYQAESGAGGLTPEIGSPDFFEYREGSGKVIFVLQNSAESFLNELRSSGAVEISEELNEILRVENGTPLYGADMDETTIVPELGIDGLISYNKGCYIGQEIIARIYFRGHIAKKLTGLVFSENLDPDVLKTGELKSAEGKSAGKLTSVIFSPALGKTIALGYVRYDYLAEGTELKIGEDSALVKNLPFV